jgi:hypothetical protein
MFNTMRALRDDLADIDGVRSCKIGVEAGISPADYPLIRLVPTRIVPGQPYNNRTVEVHVYFGANTTESEGLEYVYQQLFNLEVDIINTIKASGGRYIETLTDEDRLDTYKLMFIRFEIQAERPAIN